MHVHYILPVRRTGYATIRRMIADGAVHADPAARLQHDRLRGHLYTPTSVLPLQARTDQVIHAGPYSLPADVYRLPSTEYAALVQSTPDYVQPAFLSELLQAVQRHPADYVWVAAHKKDLHQQTRLLSLPQEPGFTATWDDERWALLERCGEWFLVLWFDLRCTARPGSLMGTAAIALDLGADPLVCAVGSDGDSWNVEPVNVCVPAPLSHLTAGHPALLDRLQFELQRGELLRFMLLLLCHATVVYAEDLTYRDMHPQFVRQARRSGLIDWHESWLHNRLAAAGIPLEKVHSRGTSRRCSACQYPHGDRQGNVFCCPRCGVQLNAHENAARNILQRGQAKAASWQSAHARTRRRQCHSGGAA